jgi:hypothetical protein
MYERALARGLTRAHLPLGYLRTYLGELPAAAQHFEAVARAHDAVRPRRALSGFSCFGLV